MNERGARQIAGTSHKWDEGIRLGELANLAHALRSPLQVLLGYVDILREDLSGELGSHALHVIERINVNAHDLARTAENILDFAYTYAEAALEHDEDIEICDLIADLAPALDALNSDRSLDLSFDIERAPARIRGRCKPLRSIVSNLAANAIKFTAEGSVTIAFRALPSRERCDMLEIAISDTGPGIDPRRLHEAFAAGRQLSDTCAREFRGMGLGLAVVRRNLDAIGASLDVDTMPGRGSRFTVRMPVRPRILVNGSDSDQSEKNDAQR